MVKYYPGHGSNFKLRLLHYSGAGFCIPTPSTSRSGFYCLQVHLELLMCDFLGVSMLLFILFFHLQLTTEFFMKILRLLFNHCHDALYGPLWHLSRVLILLSRLPVGLHQCLCPFLVCLGRALILFNCSQI
jgi:hypothetical protein